MWLVCRGRKGRRVTCVQIKEEVAARACFWEWEVAVFTKAEVTSGEWLRVGNTYD